ncbi:PHP domain-containing protein [Candidatus Similichlamydia epinepheli]|uniref:PHP domain-containing protein n=1 Tax=Candidatus Similichlamydia epinepheli TaxID=1903953 RepID=UPI00130052E1|nr:PHP domain-containing protein [Candidatus Similichlamydia epinepheli]
MVAKADLHIHSSYSDGALSPTDLIAIAVRVGLNAISITDHDTVDAYFDSDFQKKKGEIEIVSGIELSCSYHGNDVHLLGYGFDVDHMLLKAWCRYHANIRLKRGYFYFDQWEKKFRFPVAYRNEFFENHFSPLLTRCHLAKFLLKKKLAFSIREAFSRFLHAKMFPLPVELSFPDVQEGIELIHLCGGFAVLAHPSVVSASVSNSPSFLNLPFDGVELMHRNNHIKGKWEIWARTRNLYCTGGSDFHDPKRGDVVGSSWTDEATLKILSIGRRQDRIPLRLP